MTAADRGEDGARVPLAEQVETCNLRWGRDLPDTGAVSKSTRHILQWGSSYSDD
eukprot:SAG22_NODE_1360_length_4622_cov_2.212912_4_plen_54_part_00